MCAECGKSVRRTSLHMHMMQHKKKDQVCHLCNYRTQFVKSLRSHMMRIHQVTADGKDVESCKMFQCDRCPQSFFTRAELRLHLMRHDGVKPHKCPICDFSTVDVGSMKMHVRTHTGEKPYKCPHCTKSFKQSSSVANHVRTVHNHMKKYQCDMCDKAYVNRRDLEAHRCAHHLGVKPHKCTVCAYACTKKDYLYLHIVREHGKDHVPMELRPKRKLNQILSAEELSQFSQDEIAKYSTQRIRSSTKTEDDDFEEDGSTLSIAKRLYARTPGVDSHKHIKTEPRIEAKDEEEIMQVQIIECSQEDVEQHVQLFVSAGGGDAKVEEVPQYEVLEEVIPQEYTSDGEMSIVLQEIAPSSVKVEH